MKATNIALPLSEKRTAFSAVSIKAFLHCLLLIIALSGKAQRENPFGHALIPDMIADASIQEINGTFYCYATTDGYDQGLKTSGPLGAQPRRTHAIGKWTMVVLYASWFRRLGGPHCQLAACHLG